MSVTLKLELSDEIALAIIRLAARMSWSTEDAAEYLLEIGLAETGYYPTLSLDEFLRDLPTVKHR